jgi:hypothetical protein
VATQNFKGGTVWSSNNKNSYLLCYKVYYDCKKFYDTDPLKIFL